MRDATRWQKKSVLFDHYSAIQHQPHRNRNEFWAKEPTKFPKKWQNWNANYENCMELADKKNHEKWIRTIDVLPSHFTGFAS